MLSANLATTNKINLLSVRALLLSALSLSDSQKTKARVRAKSSLQVSAKLPTLLAAHKILEVSLSQNPIRVHSVKALMIRGRVRVLTRKRVAISSQFPMFSLRLIANQEELSGHLNPMLSLLLDNLSNKLILSIRIKVNSQLSVPSRNLKTQKEAPDLHLLNSKVKNQQMRGLPSTKISL